MFLFSFEVRETQAERSGLLKGSSSFLTLTPIHGRKYDLGQKNPKNLLHIEKCGRRLRVRF